MHTTHGAHIPGTRLGNNPPLRLPRCGGVDQCPDCILEASAVYRTQQIHLMVLDKEVVTSVHEIVDYNREEYYDDATIMRVYLALCDAGADDQLARRAINVMLKQGILFRERNPRS